MIIVLFALQLTISAEAFETLQKIENYMVVDINGGGDYTSIQEAVNNALEGSTIYVKRGEYKEIIEIKKGINLIGEDKESTIINPISGDNKYAVLLSGSSSTIRNFTIKNGGKGIYTSAIRVISDGNEIVDCIIYDTPVGIAIFSSNNTIDNCSFIECKDEGIALIGSSIECKNNRILNSIFSGNCDGIELQYSSDNIIYNCKFYNSTHTAISGISEANNRNLIYNCDIYKSGIYGIYFVSSEENKIVGCKFAKNRFDDIVFSKNSKNNTISKSLNNLAARIRSIRQRFLDRLHEKLSPSKASKIIKEIIENEYEKKYGALKNYLVG